MGAPGPVEVLAEHDDSKETAMRPNLEPPSSAVPTCPWCGSDCERVPVKGEARSVLACPAWGVCGWIEGCR